MASLLSCPGAAHRRLFAGAGALATILLARAGKSLATSAWMPSKCIANDEHRHQLVRNTLDDVALIAAAPRLMMGEQLS